MNFKDVSKNYLIVAVSKKKYIKTQIKFDEGKININVHVNNVPKEGFQYICLLRLGKF